MPPLLLGLSLMSGLVQDLLNILIKSINSLPKSILNNKLIVYYHQILLYISYTYDRLIKYYSYSLLGPLTIINILTSILYYRWNYLLGISLSLGMIP